MSAGLTAAAAASAAESDDIFPARVNIIVRVGIGRLADCIVWRSSAAAAGGRPRNANRQRKTQTSRNARRTPHAQSIPLLPLSLLLSRGLTSCLVSICVVMTQCE